MTDYIPLPYGQQWPLPTGKTEPICFRTLGQVLARKPWCGGLFGADYSYADHLLLLASQAKRSLKLEALLMHVHMAMIEAPVLPLIKTNETLAPRLALQRAPHDFILHNSIRIQIRHAADLDRHMPVEIENYLQTVEDSVIQAELRDLTHGLPRTVFANAVATKRPVQAGKTEVSAAEWADQVEQRIPRIMAMREPLDDVI